MSERTNIERRQLFLGAAAFSLATIAPGMLAWSNQRAFAQDEVKDTPENNDAQYGFMVKVSRCVNCGKCVEACKEKNKTPEDIEPRRRISSHINSDGREYHISTSCMHCAEPSCASVCPATAITKGEGGIVSVDLDRCMGCKYCYQACPFSVPQYTSGGMDKCDCCLGVGIAVGEEPWCVRACKYDALRYGEIEKMKAMSRSEIQSLDSSTNPSFFLV